jgi:hypothetical protein
LLVDFATIPYIFADRVITVSKWLWESFESLSCDMKNTSSIFGWWKDILIIDLLWNKYSEYSVVEYIGE